jgi:hypothetical protein
MEGDIRYLNATLQLPDTEAQIHSSGRMIRPPLHLLKALLLHYRISLLCISMY